MDPIFLKAKNHDTKLTFKWKERVEDKTFNLSHNKKSTVTEYYN
jgi:hypothetical protein